MTAEFDRYAARYDEVLNAALAATGEDAAFFLRGRAQWLARCLAARSVRAQSLLDFGCGVGSAAPVFLDVLGVDSILGVDVSPGVVDAARRDHGSPRVHFALRDEQEPDGRFDLAFTNGVFHHIPRAEQAAAAAYVFRTLRPGGLLAFWENNPWNPGTQYVMSRCAFDRDAVTLAPRTARRLLRAAGFEVLRTDFLFVFPRSLHSFRPLEPFLTRWPIGAQYQVLGRKP